MLRILSFLGLLGLVYGCGGADNGSGSPTASAEASDTPAADPAALPSGSGGMYTEDKGTGKITGAIRWEGKAPRRRRIDMGAEKFCTQRHTDPVLSETTVVGPTGGLANVFVYVKKGLKGWKFEMPGETKVLDQNGCVYVPHVMGIMTGQKITIRNDDPIMHNVHASDMRSKRDMFNFGQTKQGAEGTKSFRKPGFIKVKCDVHGWMGSYICVVKHPFYAVTTEDGTFALDKLPPGTYEIAAWHEKWGTKSQTVTIADGQAAELSFTFSK